jgi:DNA-3-methyladenine glycosylase I
VTEALVDGDVLDRGEDGLLRCFWGGGTDEYRAYHDTEWGRAIRDDTLLFEKICLEGFQSGLSWLTILRKRDNFRSAFAAFDVNEVAGFGDRDVARLLQDAGIVRHRGKIESTINNAQRCLELYDAGETLSDLVWGFAPDPDSRPPTVTRQWLMDNPQTPESKALSRELKRRGWSFVGPTTMYAFLQSVGVVDDHQAGCHVGTASSR